LVKGREPERELKILDVGTGSADIPKALCRWARRSKIRLQVTATDARPEMLSLAEIKGYPEIRLRQADARQLPDDAAEFDIVTSSLLLHHLSRPDAVVVLAEMRRAALLGVVVNDLVRNSVSYVLARFLAHAGTSNRLTRYDGPLSVRRSMTLRELLALVGEAGLEIEHVEQFGLYRAAVAAVV
jgi:ubiquinone/menaquinone biosynthesis C-methylase UbiE